MREAAKEIAVREAEEREIGKNGVDVHRREKCERVRGARFEERMPADAYDGAVTPVALRL